MICNAERERKTKKNFKHHGVKYGFVVIRVSGIVSGWHKIFKQPYLWNENTAFEYKERENYHQTDDRRDKIKHIWQ